MFRRIKNLFKPEKPEPRVITFDAIPRWLDDREGTLTGALLDTTASPMHAIRESVTSLQQTIELLRAAEYNEEIHPKLKSIAKNTLPQYSKAMGTLLSKSLPEDVDGFYTAATEILKGCINSTRGQGKYLRTVFPQEMKSVQTGIDAIGRQINAMTDALAHFRKEMEHITEAKRTHGALADINMDIEKSFEKEKRIGHRIDDTRNRFGECEQELATLGRDESQGILAEQRHTLELMIEERDRTVRRYAVLSMTASHVLRKAEKLAHKQRKSADEAALHRAMGVLSGHGVPDATDLAKTLAAAYPIAVKMIDCGEVLLKNKEERALFSDPGGFINEIRTLSQKYTTQVTQCEAAEHSLRSHPVVARSETLEREKAQLEIILKKEIQSRADLITWRVDLNQRIPGLQQRLKKVMGDISGNDVQIQYSPIPVPSP
jgi:hypothetical protein